MTIEFDDNQLAKQGQTGLRAALRILEQWHLAPQDKAAILSISPRIVSLLEPVFELRTEQLERISHVLNIHAALRELFQNPENVSNYMTAINHNPPFNGITPLAMIRSGQIDALKKIVDHLENLKNGGW